MIKNTARQIFRTPVKTVLFVLLIALSVAIFSVGAGMYLKNTKMLDEIDDQFVTRGTVEQLSIGEEVVSNVWGTWEEPIYGDLRTVEEFADLPYKVPIENRPTYLARLYRNSETVGYEQIGPNTDPDFSNYRSTNPNYNAFIIFEPMEDFYSNEEGEAMIKEVLWGASYSNVTTPSDEGFLFRFGNPYNLSFFSGEDLDLSEEVFDPGELLKKGERYISLAWLSGERFEPLVKVDYIDQYHTESVEIASYPVPYTDDFFETEMGKEFQCAIDNTEISTYFPFPIVPTNDINLIDSFYTGESRMVIGREITPEEFERGDKVCMISTLTANTFSINVGDEIDASFFAKSYSMPPMSVYYSLFMYSTTSPMELLEKETYEVVGVFAYGTTLEDYSPDGLPPEAVIMPEKSIENHPEAVVGAGPMRPMNTSFLIENNMLSTFKAEVEKLGMDDISITYYDMGYNKVKTGIDNVLFTAKILLVVGGVSVLCLIVLYLFLQITRKSQETAIQISLGTGKAKTAMSLLLGVMIVVLIGAAVGAVGGYFITDNLAENAYSEAVEASFSGDYSENAIIDVDNQEYQYDSTGEWIYAALSAALIVVVTLVLAIVFIVFSLKKEPIKLLSKGGTGV